MYIENVKIGGLYTTEQDRSTITLFQNHHHRYEAENMYSDNFLYPDEYFIILEKKEINGGLTMCLKVLTTSGVIGWTTLLHRDKKYAPVRFKKVEL